MAGDVEMHAFVASIAGATPICNGQTATIYVNVEGRIIGGPDNGKLYKQKLEGPSGVDVIVGTSGKDDIDAKAGNDVVCGGGGDDVLEGAGGNDQLFGEIGNDRLLGGAGKDTLTGGSGADKFRGGPGKDTATDFNPGEGDTKTGVENFQNMAASLQPWRQKARSMQGLVDCAQLHYSSMNKHILIVSMSQHPETR